MNIEQKKKKTSENQKVALERCSNNVKVNLQNKSERQRLFFNILIFSKKIYLLSIFSQYVFWVFFSGSSVIVVVASFFLNYFLFVFCFVLILWLFGIFVHNAVISFATCVLLNDARSEFSSYHFFSSSSFLFHFSHSTISSLYFCLCYVRLLLNLLHWTHSYHSIDWKQNNDNKMTGSARNEKTKQERN